MRHGITRVEFLIVVALGLFAAGLAVVGLSSHRENALRMQCTNNLRRIGEAFEAYDSTSAARALPPSRLAENYATWAVFLAPHLARKNPLQSWDLQQSYFAQTDEVRQARLIMYFCPTRTRTGTLSQAGDVDANQQHVPGGLGDYACVAGDGGAGHDWTGPSANGALIIADVLKRQDDRIVKWRSRTSFALLERQRGRSYILLVGEKHVPADKQGDAAVGDGSFYNGQNPASFSRVAGPGFPLAASLNAPFNNNFGSYHTGICNFLLADTSVRAMPNQTTEMVLGEMARRGE